MRRSLAAVGCALLLLLGAGCGGTDSGTGTGAGTGPVDDPTSAIDPAPPATEDPDALEEADEPGQDAVALELPGLPVGGDSEVVSATLQCVDVGWSGPDIPAGIRVGLDGIAFMPADGFTASDAPCPGEAPRCVGEGFWITAALERCAQAVAWTGRPTIDEQRMLMYRGGTIACVPDRLDECRDFGEAVLANGPESIDLEPHPDELLGGLSEPDTTDEPDPAAPEPGENGPGAPEDGPSDDGPSDDGPSDGAATDPGPDDEDGG